MPDFLEERISGLIRMGSSYVDDYAVDIVQTSGGQEYRSLVHPFPVRKFDISYLLDNNTTYAELQGIYHRAHGRFAGFRARCFDEWSSNGRVGVPTAFDQTLGYVSPGVYQLRKYYGTDKTAGSSGYAYREIRKPVSGTVKVGYYTPGLLAAFWEIDVTTGRVTFPYADVTANITSISKATQAVIGFVSHPYSVGESVYIGNVSGMTQINGLRGEIVAKTSSTITVNINTTLFSTYSSGGVCRRNPQVGEVLSAGFEFDFPVRFNTSMPIGQDFPGYRQVDGVELIELLNP